jgi:predicted enzyme related to lactoylglutathione lyase
MTSPQPSQTLTAHPPGTPIWVDLTTPDVKASARFYSELFGWQVEDMGEAMGNYHMFRQGGKSVAAATPPMGNPGQPPAWTTYVSSANAEETAQKVTAAGGTVLVAPMAVGEEGTFAVFMDPAGGAIAIWQAGRMKGSELFNTPVSLTWNELQTRDLEAAKGFYPKVFGWGIHENDMPGGGKYVEWQVNGKSIAGGMTMPPQMPANVPSFWLPYFTVASLDQTIKRAQELGGKVMAPPMDIPQGRFAVLTDPQGASFAVIQPPAK